MKRNGSNRINEPRWMKNVLVQNFALMVLFIIPLFANTLEPRLNAWYDSHVQACLNSVNSDSRPYHDEDLPTDSNDSPLGETPSENGLEEEVDSDEDGKEYWHRHIPRNIAYILTQTSWVRCGKTFENNHTVSLFILHHSWKSYLS
jgi:hypothetical protein